MTTKELEQVFPEYSPTPGENRCDRCDSRAYFRFIKGSLQLEWCHHHGQKYKETLIEKGWHMQDRSDILHGEAASYKKVYGKNAF